MIPSAPSVLQKGIIMLWIFLIAGLALWITASYFWYKPVDPKAKEAKAFDKWVQEQKRKGPEVVLIETAGGRYMYEKNGARYRSPEDALDDYWKVAWERAKAAKTEKPPTGFVVLTEDEYTELMVER